MECLFTWLKASRTAGRHGGGGEGRGGGTRVGRDPGWGGEGRGSGGMGEGGGEGVRERILITANILVNFAIFEAVLTTDFGIFNILALWLTY